MQAKERLCLNGFTIIALSIILFVFAFGAMVPAAALGASDSLNITGDGVTTPTTFTLDQLKEMKQYEYVYSCINTWPTKKWYVGKGVKLRDLLDNAGMTDEATLIRFTSTDGYTVNLTVKELLQDERYCFPNFKASSGDADGHIPGNSSGRVKVEPIIGLVSTEGSNNPKYMNDMNSLLLMMGQRIVTEQTGNLFVKYLNKIEVLTDEPEKWDAPRANPKSGIVPAGTMVTLSNLHNDDDKIYYTLDNGTPNLNSPMYNWIASRWWVARADVLGKINRPIGPINKDTTIKAITIGPGKLDSDCVTFTYSVDGWEPGNEKVIKLIIGRMAASVDGAPYTLDAAPYINAKVGRTLVPVRFVSEVLGAGVDWNPKARQVIITDGQKEIILTIDFCDVQVDGGKQTIDCAPVILPPGRTFIPIRFVSEILGAEVDYDETGEITITR